jgi:gliding motility-associated-like protein
MTAYEVIGGGIEASFIADPDFGFSPLPVTFINTSAASTNSSNIISVWGYGDGVVTPTMMNSSVTGHTYQAAGTYTVYLKVQKGSCIDTAMRIVRVELPSKLEIPNVFTPNGDKSNDIFRLRATNLAKIYIIIYDRWGNKVYEVTSETGNFAWDGTNFQGKECSDGTYFYILKAEGKDGTEFEHKGNVSLFR